MAFYSLGAPVGTPKSRYRGKTYTYYGPVFINGMQCGLFSGDTKAYNINKAFENLTFRARREAGYDASAMFIQLDFRCIREKY